MFMAMRMMVSMMTWRSRPSRNAPPFSNWALRIPLDPLHILKKDLRKNQASKADRRFTKDSLTNTSRIPKIKPAKIILLVLITLIVIRRSGETPDRGLIKLSVWSFENILFFDDDISSTPDDNVLWWRRALCQDRELWWRDFPLFCRQFPRLGLVTQQRGGFR